MSKEKNKEDSKDTKLVTTSADSLQNQGEVTITAPEEITVLPNITKEEFIKNDPLVQMTESGGSPLQVLKILRNSVAQEQAALSYQRRVLEESNKDSTTISVKRIEALSKMASIELDIQRLSAQSIDPNDPRLGLLINLFITKLEIAALDSLASEQIDILFNKFSSLLKNWSEEVTDLFRLDESDAVSYLEKIKKEGTEEVKNKVKLELSATDKKPKKKK